MKQINMLESPVRQVFFSYLVPSISATLVTSIYILADTMNDVRSRRQRSLWVFQRTRR